MLNKQQQKGNYIMHMYMLHRFNFCKLQIKQLKNNKGQRTYQNESMNKISVKHNNRIISKENTCKFQQTNNYGKCHNFNLRLATKFKV